tara:strand:- start:1043 stop:2941 length:1899 start_codon:yes stop_codon:yes gene_type:complete
MTDQDLDGSHIKGLCINMFHSEWGALTKIPGFISFMNTPILRAKKGSQTQLFYNDGEYNTWKEGFGEQGPSGWNIKYFKGLGTSTSAEFKDYFANKKIVNFVHTNSSDDMIDRIFNKKRTDDRKRWLENYNKDAYLNTSHKDVNYEDFINQELIHFSTYDCARSIPNMVDGLKISLRKILYSAFKRKLTSEIKVAQFSGYVSEHSAYHHGEASLNGAIVNMAQNFVGSNNINLLEPNGQFGTRLQGGDDSASERYIFTLLNSLTRCIFPEQDDPVLHYLNDDGTIVEPEYYVPIIPFTLVNGISGIGTGFSCNMLAYNPLEIVEALKLLLKKKPITHMDFQPYYEGFTGSVSKLDDNKYLIKGTYEKIDNDKIRITELPIGTWTMPYITFLESLVDGSTKNGKKVAPTLRDFTSLSTEVKVDITVVFPRGKLSDYESQIDEHGVNGVEKMLKLTTTQSSTNMHMFNNEHKLHKYKSVHEIIEEFYPVRLDMYKKRKDYLIANLEKLLQKLSNKSKYILLNLDGKVDLRKKTNVQVEELLMKHSLDKLEGDYKYLTKMPMDSVTEEHVAHLLKEKEKMEKEYETLKSTTLEQMWKKELEGFEKEYAKYKEKRKKIQESTEKTIKTKKVVKKKK